MPVQRSEQAPRTPLSDVGLDVEELVHDLRQELCVVRHLVDRLHLPLPPPDLEELLGHLRTELAAVDRLVRSAVPAGRGRSDVDVRRTAHDVVAAAGVVHDGPVVLEASGAAVVDADGVLLRRALLDLVVNACEASPGGTVRVVVTGEPHAVVVDVVDTGCGGDPDADVPGLGQWVVHAVVRDLGGTVVRTALPGGGRRVSVRLPGSAP